MKKTGLIFIVIAMAALLLTACNPVVSAEGQSKTTVRPGEKRTVASFSITAKSLMLEFKGIAKVTADSGLLKNMTIIKRDDLKSAPIENFSFIIPSKQTCVFDIVADVVSDATTETVLKLADFKFSEKNFRKSLSAKDELSFPILIKMPAAWSDAAEVNSEPADLRVSSVGINQDGRSIIQAVRRIDYDFDELQLYTHAPSGEWSYMCPIFDKAKAEDSHIMIDDEGNILSLWIGMFWKSPSYKTVLARRIADGIPDAKTIELTESRSSGVYKDISFSSNTTSGRACVLEYDSPSLALAAYQLSTKDNAYRRDVLGSIRFYIGFTRLIRTDPKSAVSADGSMCAAWIDNTNSLLVRCFPYETSGDGIWSEAARMNDDQTWKCLEFDLASNGMNGFSLVWSESKGDRYRLVKKDFTPSNYTAQAEIVYEGETDFLKPAIALGGKSACIIFTDGDGMLYALTEGIAGWQEPLAISHRKTGYEKPFLSGDIDGNFIIGYDARENRGNYLYGVYFDSLLGWMPPVRLSEDCTFGSTPLNQIAMSKTGHAVAAWLIYEDDKIIARLFN